MKEITAASGIVLFEDGSNVIVADRRTAGLYTAVFVFLLLAVIPCGAGIFFIIQGGGMLIPGLILVGAGGLFGTLSWWMGSMIRNRNRRGPGELKTLFTLDFDAGQLRDGEGTNLAALSTVRVGRRMQLGSSSPALEFQWEGGSAILARGNPFAGGIGSIEENLNRRLPSS